MYTVAISGSLAYDHIMDFPDLFRNHFLPDKLHNINVSFNIRDHAEHFGGTAGNIAYTLALLEEKAGIIATAGNDFSRYAEHLRAAGLDLESVHIVEDLATSFAYILTDRADNQISAFYPGAGARPYAADLPACTIAILAPGSLEDMRAFPEIFRKLQLPFFFDPGQAIPALSSDELRNGIEGAEAVFTNDYEFTLLCQRTGWNEADILNHAKTCVITMGAEGTRLLLRNGGFKIAGVPTDKLVDPTGAGDAFRAGYAKGYLAKLPAEQCIRLGSAAAVYAVESVGTQAHRFTMTEFRQRFESAYSEKCPV